RGHVCWDEHDLIDGRPTGLVRVSLGWMSTWEDVAAFLGFVRKHFVNGAPLQATPEFSPKKPHVSGPSPVLSASAASQNVDNEAEPPRRPQRVLEAIYVYPIKSCAPQRAGPLSRLTPSSPSSRRDSPLPSSLPASGARVTAEGGGGGGGGGDGGTGVGGSAAEGRGSWPLGPSGLAYDREWALVDHRDRALRLKQVPAMCRIRPFVDLAADTLTISAPKMPDLVLPLDYRGGEGGGGGGGRGASDDARETDFCGFRSQNSNGDRGVGFGDRAVGVDESAARGADDDGDGEGGNVSMVVRVCGNRRAGVTCAASASAWFTRFLGVPCSLVRAAAAAADDAAADSGADAGADGGAGNGHRAATDILSPDERTAATDIGGVGGGGVGGAITSMMPWFQAAAGLLGRGRAPSAPTTPGIPAATAVTAGQTKAGTSSRAFANEAEFLLISRASVDKVNDVIRRESGIGVG
ncbi:unnamed protein product, partial [Hapterophycus canaliculatus]